MSKEMFLILSVSFSLILSSKWVQADVKNVDVLKKKADDDFFIQSTMKSRNLQHRDFIPSCPEFQE